jgi:cytochrome P450
VLTMAMLGLPLADWEIYCEPAHAGIYTKPDSPDLPRVQEQTMRMVMQLAGCIGQARATPRPGIIKALIDADINGAPLRDDGILGTVFLVIGGGFDTTTALTANAINWLSQHPDERQRLRTEPELLGTATEEFLRYFSPSQGDARTVTQDCEIGGYTFAERDRILLSFGMTNRDPAIFEEPDELRLDRFPNRHSAFGLGNHRCIGSNIARMQFKAIMSEALARIPDFAVGSDGVERYESIGVINGYKHLPITFPPGQRDGEGLAATLVRWQADLDAEAAAASPINDQEQAQR